VQSFNFHWLLNLAVRGKEIPMRRGVAFLVGMVALGSLTPAAFGQYPYPYGPMPVHFAPPYGYPTPMPGYVAPAMMPGPGYYGPPPMLPPAMDRNTKVFVYGPLTDTPRMPQPAMVKPAAAPVSSLMAVAPKQEALPAGVTQAHALRMRAGALPTYSKAELEGDACGDDCGPDGGAACGGPYPYEPPMRGKGHHIAEVGAYFIVPFISPRTAFITTTAGATTATDFPRQLDIGPRVALGYVFHSGWGVRADYWYLKGSISREMGNADPATTVALPGFGIRSPSAALLAGIGVDQFTATQKLEMHVADVEAIRESHVFDTTLLFGVGVRYAHVFQSYNGARTNPGGIAGGTTVAFDREDFESINRFDGWGPTVSIEAIHPLQCGFALYGDLRGSFLFGTDRFTQSSHVQNRSVTAAGVPTFTDTFTLTDAQDNVFVPIFEAEAGVQYGCRLGRCYLFARAGVVYQRWWEVGSPTAPQANITFFGGTARLGITY
jgi:hypothetical protein